MFRWKVTAATLAIAALALTGCAVGASSADNDGAGEGGGSLVLTAVSMPTTLDPSGAEWGNRSPFYQAMYDTLLLATPDGEIVPWLASNWSYNDNRTELTLTLRDDVEFTDGSELNADVVVDNLQRFKDGTSPNAGYFADVASFEATEDLTVVITLNAPDPALLNYLSRDAGLIASGEAIADGDLSTNPIGSGPYVLDVSASVDGTSYVYTRNPDYWNPDVQHYDGLTVNVVSDPTAQLNVIKAGEANGVRLSASDNNSEIEGAGWGIDGVENGVWSFLLLDRDGAMAPELADVRVRQALNYAFDRQTMLDALQDGNGTATTQMFPATSEAFDSELDERYPYDPEKAKELLAEAGYPDGFTLSVPTSSKSGTSIYAILEQQLTDIGINVEFTDAGANFTATILTPKFPVAFMPLEQNSDWQLINFMIAPGATFNPFGTETPEADALLQQTQYGDEAQQASAAAELNEYLVDEAWFVPLYRTRSEFATDANTSVEVLPSNAYPNVYDFQPNK